MKDVIYAFFVFLFFSCQQTEKSAGFQTETAIKNPAADGFNFKDSDQSAISIADDVMEAMGGIEAWNNIRYISWQFFNSRKLWWDKWTDDVRVESLKSDLKILVNIHDLTGKVYKDRYFASNGANIYLG